MRKINLLDENIINQIAAGEVIDRPSAIIKELVENSIDAGATELIIKIKNGGITSISIEDNGSGIEEEDVENAFKKYATSKITSVEDLFAIDTLGFRGEALASISSISKIILETKTESGQIGLKYNIIDGKIISSEKVKRRNGTTIMVEDIFYNIPARKKFLKSVITEKNYILNEITSLILKYNVIDFKVFLDEKVYCDLKSTEDEFKRYSEVLKINSEDFFKLTDTTDSNFKINGYFSMPNKCSMKKGVEYIYVNGRNIKDPIIRKAILTAYSGFIPHGFLPQFILNIEVNPKFIDVNVHPRKLEVRWEDTNYIFSKIQHSIKNKLEKILKVVVRESLNVNEDTQTRDFAPVYVSENINPYNSNEKIQTQNGDLNYKTKSLNLSNRLENGSKLYSTKHALSFVDNLISEEFKIEENDVKSFGFTKSFQLLNTYLVLEYPDKVQIIDQHAAAERVKYDKIVKIYKTLLKSEFQGLLIPQILNLNKSQKEIMNFLLPFLSKIGIEITELRSEFVLTSYSIVYDSSLPDIIIEICDLIIESGEDFEKSEIVDKYFDKIISLIACHNSIRGGYEMSTEEINWLVGELFNTDFPYSCPHGRPTIWELKKNDFEKQFGRIK
jgi:DNA mismatch repair protein MutL